MTLTSSITPKLLIMVGSLRAASSSRALAETIAERVSGEAETVFAEIGNLPLYNSDITNNPDVEAFIEQVRQADGALFVTPEYNYSIPGVLKNAIDWASRPSYQSVFFGKPCFVMTVSGGALGGVRAQGHLKQVLNGMASHLFPSQEVVVPFANDKVENGRFTHDPTLEFATARLLAFLEFAEQLRA